MENQFKFDYRDILRTPAEALKAKKIAVATMFFCLAVGIYTAFIYLALAIEGENIKLIYSMHGLLPFFKMTLHNFSAQSVWGLGIMLSLFSVMLAMFSVAAIEIESIRGNPFFSIFGAIKFSFKRIGQLFLSELSIALFLLLIIGLFALLGLVSRIPYIGEWIFTVLFVLPNFVIGLLTVFVGFILIMSMLLLPAVAAAERRGEVFDAILETFSTIMRQPVRWIMYTLYALVTAKVCSFVYAYFAYRAVQFVTAASSLGGGAKLQTLVRGSLSHLPIKSDVANIALHIFPGWNWGFSLTRWVKAGTGSPAEHLMAVMLFIIFATVIGYALSVIATGQARGYVALRFIKDSHNIAEEAPLFFTPDHVNRPIDGGEDNQ